MAALGKTMLAAAWSPYWTRLPTLTSINDWIAGLQGKITPSDEQAIRAEAATAVTKAGGTPADVQQVQHDISSSLETYGGSSLPEFGGSIWPSPFGVDLKWWLLGGAGVLAAILIIKD
jgi:hypothetical protein